MTFVVKLYLSFNSKSFILTCPVLTAWILKCTKLQLAPYLFMWASNLVSHSKERTWTENDWEDNPKDNI